MFHNTIFIQHRINNIDNLKSCTYGIEFDIRDSLIITHDPNTSGPNLNDYLNNVSKDCPMLIVNIKCENLENDIINLLQSHDIKNYFFLDSSFPIIYKFSKIGIKNFALRFSEFESIETLINMKGLVDWVWVDCFTKFPMNIENNKLIKDLGYKICIVSPELQNRKEDIILYKRYILDNNLQIDAICTKYPDIWKQNVIRHDQKDLSIIIKEKDHTNRDIILSKWSNIYLTGYNTNYPNILYKKINSKYYILPTRDKIMSLNKESIYEENGMNYFEDEKDEKDFNIIEDDVLYFIYDTNNYYHFIYDMIPYLYYYKYLSNSKLLMSENAFKYKFVKETLNLFGIFDENIIIHNKNNLYKNIYTGTSLTHNGLSNNEPRNEIFEIYNILIKNASKYLIHVPEKIYISRRTWIHNDLSNIGTNYTTKRKLMNEDEIVEKLNNEDFTEVFCENLSMIDKINLFNNSKYIIGAIGGGMCNLVFSKKDTKVLILVSPTFLEINGRFIYSMYHTDIKYINGTLIPESHAFHKFTRIKYKDYIGEIIDYDNEKYIIQLSSNDITGFSTNETYHIITLEEHEFTNIDNGLNSPWFIDIKNLIL